MNAEFGYRPLSLSGVPLAGNRIVRTIYVDESGTSANEKILVVAGVIIDADRQWMDIANYVGALIKEYVPAEKRIGYVIHATRLFNGYHMLDPGSCRNEMDLLRKLMEIPRLFGISVGFGALRKVAPPDHVNTPKKQKKFNAILHAMAHIGCVIACEKYMIENALPNEIATMVAENREEAKSIVKHTHDLMRGAIGDVIGFIENMDENWCEYLPVKRIVDTVHFAGKNDALYLQLADAFAFVFRRFLEGKTRGDELYTDLLGKPSAYTSLREHKLCFNLLAHSYLPRLKIQSTFGSDAKIQIGPFL